MVLMCPVLLGVCVQYTQQHNMCRSREWRIIVATTIIKQTTQQHQVSGHIHHSLARLLVACLLARVVGQLHHCAELAAHHSIVPPPMRNRSPRSSVALHLVLLQHTAHSSA